MPNTVMYLSDPQYNGRWVYKMRIPTCAMVVSSRFGVKVNLMLRVVFPLRVAIIYVSHILLVCSLVFLCGSALNFNRDGNTSQTVQFSFGFTTYGPAAT